MKLPKIPLPAEPDRRCSAFVPLAVLWNNLGRAICALGKVDLRWAPNQKLNGPIRRLTLGLVALRSLARWLHPRPVTFVTRRSGQSEVARLSGATIRVVVLQKRTGVIRWLGTT